MTNSDDELLDQAIGGDESAFDRLFAQNRDRLRRAVRVSLHPLVRARVDESDILQESYLKAMNNIGSYEVREDKPFYLWLRFIAKQQVVEAHRAHLDAKMRSMHAQASLDGDSALSDVIAARLKTASVQGPLSELAERELSQKVRQVLVTGLSDPDREILLLRHFEMLTNEEVAHELGISRSNASSRYIRALTRLRKLLHKELGGNIE